MKAEWKDVPLAEIATPVSRPVTVLIINKIWGRHGSTAIASEAVDGCVASNEFPTFELDQNAVLPR